MIANNPLRLGGCLNSESAEKAARFVRLCDAFGILMKTRSGDDESDVVAATASGAAGHLLHFGS